MITPLSDYLVVRPIEDVPDPNAIVSPYGGVRRYDSDPMRGTVIAAGPGYVSHSGTLVPNPVSVGDVVVLQFNAGTDIRIDGEVFRVVPARDLFGIVTA